MSHPNSFEAFSKPRRYGGSSTYDIAWAWNHDANVLAARHALGEDKTAYEIGPNGLVMRPYRELSFLQACRRKPSEYAVIGTHALFYRVSDNKIVGMR